jgi:hypothetical protein
MMKEINYTFNEYARQLKIMENFSGNMLIHYNYYYTPEVKDAIFNQPWVKAMAVAQSKLMQSTITGKYAQALIGGATINYSDMRARAETEIGELKEELFTKYAGPAPIMII